MKSRILVVDDEETMRETLEMLLEHWGYEVKTAPDGSEITKLIQGFKPDILFLNYNMPGKDGLQLLPEIKILKHDLPVIIISGSGIKGIDTQSLELGAIAFMSKPLDYEGVKKIISIALSKKFSENPA